MSVRSHIEINHDLFDLAASDKEIADALRAYVRSAGTEQAARLRRLGMNRFWWGHHSCPEVAAADKSRTKTEPRE